jgi:hypothetical protein
MPANRRGGRLRGWRGADRGGGCMPSAGTGGDGGGRSCCAAAPLLQPASREAPAQRDPAHAQNAPGTLAAACRTLGTAGNKRHPAGERHLAQAQRADRSAPSCSDAARAAHNLCGRREWCEAGSQLGVVKLQLLIYVSRDLLPRRGLKLRHQARRVTRSLGRAQPTHNFTEFPIYARYSSGGGGFGVQRSRRSPLPQTHTGRGWQFVQGDCSDT